MDTKRKIRVGITHGDPNGVGYEVILKTFEDEKMLEFCTPILYGSPKAAAYYRKALGLQTGFSIVQNANEASSERLSVINCCDDDLKVEMGVPDAAAGAAALDALERAIKDYKEGAIDVIVTGPINKHTIQSETFNFPGHTEYIQERLGENHHALMILMSGSLRVALATGHLPLKEVSAAITKELLLDKLQNFAASLNDDFGIVKPRIAVLSLNPHAGDEGLLGDEEVKVIQPVIEELSKKGMFVFGPFAADGFFGSNNYSHFDGILAMYHDQGLAPFKALAMDSGVNFTAGLPVVRTSPAHGTAFGIAGKNVADESSFRSAIYTAIDIYRHRSEEKEISKNPLRKGYFDRRDDSDKLRLDQEDRNN
ncbi:MAG: 4-hydroxythreonine-4-phosphate dehydrogenase PdxA [Bacteroidaceae bacterium]